MLNDKAALLEAALQLAAKGGQVLPLYHPLGQDECSCGQRDCSEIGKHSRVTVEEATDNEAQIREWWGEYPYSNIGLCIGAQSGTVVLNVDGEAGETALAALERRYGALPATLESRTGRGRHLYFVHPNHGTRLNADDEQLGSGLSLLADSRYVIVPPSRHRTGCFYTFNEAAQRAKFPDWMMDLVKESSKPEAEIEKQEAIPASSKAAVSESHVPQLGGILDEIEGLIRRYISLPSPEQAMLIACWIANTYTCKLFPYCGYISIRSMTPQCGKTRLLELLAKFSNGNPPITTAPTPATIFRSTRVVHIFDEVDRLGETDKEVAGMVIAILNQGFKRGARVERASKSQNGQFGVEGFEVYGPKAFAGLERLTDTLADRSFLIPMTRASQRVPRFARDIEQQAERIREQLTRWAAHHQAMIEEEIANLPDELTELTGYDDRFQDIAEPLVVLARLADRERPGGELVTPRLLAGLKSAARERTPSTLIQQHIDILEILSSLLPKGADDTFVPSDTLFTACKEREILSSIQSTKALAMVMSGLGQASRSDGQRRGYHIRRDWLQERRSSYRLK